MLSSMVISAIFSNASKTKQTEDNIMYYVINLDEHCLNFRSEQQASDSFPGIK